MLLLLDDEEVCPKCNRLVMLDSKTAIDVATRLVRLTSELYRAELKIWERDTLLGNLAARRGLLSREYFKEYSMLQIGKLANLTLLMKQVTSDPLRMPFSFELSFVNGSNIHLLVANSIIFLALKSNGLFG